MLTICHSVRPSRYGMGLFADEKIAAGRVVYVPDTRFTLIVPQSEIAQMPEGMRRRMENFSYRGKPPFRLDDAVYYNADDSRFMNHDDRPSCIYHPDTEEYTAVRDLEPGDELTCDYNDFCERGDTCFDF